MGTWGNEVQGNEIILLSLHSLAETEDSLSDSSKESITMILGSYKALGMPLALFKWRLIKVRDHLHVTHCILLCWVTLISMWLFSPHFITVSPPHGFCSHYSSSHPGPKSFQSYSHSECLHSLVLAFLVHYKMVTTPTMPVKQPVLR